MILCGVVATPTVANLFMTQAIRPLVFRPDAQEIQCCQKADGDEKRKFQHGVLQCEMGSVDTIWQP